jgi:hypothetical protein
MERDAIRLECLKLAIGKTADHTEALKRARDYVNFVTEDNAQSQAQRTGGLAPQASKQTGNSSSI